MKSLRTFIIFVYLPLSYDIERHAKKNVWIEIVSLPKKNLNNSSKQKTPSITD